MTQKITKGKVLATQQRQKEEKLARQMQEAKEEVTIRENAKHAMELSFAAEKRKTYVIHMPSALYLSGNITVYLEEELVRLFHRKLASIDKRLQEL